MYTGKVVVIAAKDTLVADSIGSAGLHRFRMLSGTHGKHPMLMRRFWIHILELV